MITFGWTAGAKSAKVFLLIFPDQDGWSWKTQLSFLKKKAEMGDTGAFVALFRFHGPFLLNEGHLFVLFQPARQCQALAGGDILPHQPLDALSLLLPNNLRDVLQIISFSFFYWTPVPSAGATPIPSPGATGQAGQAGFRWRIIRQGLYFFWWMRPHYIEYSSQVDKPVSIHVQEGTLPLSHYSALNLLHQPVK